MDLKNHFPETLVEAVRFFTDLDVAHAFFVAMRWPNGPVCPHCDSKDVRYLSKYRRFQCSHNHPNRQFTVKTGSVMEDSPMGLDKWAVVFWLEANAKNSISSYEIHRALGITQKSAWFMLHRIRAAVASEDFEKMGGSGRAIEADETFIGGRSEFMHKVKRRQKITGGGTKDKTPVFGLLERHTTKGKSKVRAVVMDSYPSKKSLQPIIQENVKAGSSIYTDSHAGYMGLNETYLHDFVDHAEAYVKDKVVHTNGLENFWSLFKRCIKGTHVSIEPCHLFRYVDSEAFRFNNRDMKDPERFVLAVRGCHGKRLTYKALTGALEPPPGNGNGKDAGNGNLIN